MSSPQEIAEQQLLAFVRGQGSQSFIVRIIRDEGRWIVTRSPLSCAPSVGDGASFGEAWLDADRVSEMTAGWYSTES